MALTRKRAARLLKDAGFTCIRGSKGHEQWTKNGIRIMLSVGRYSDELDPATERRVIKLCGGGMTGRDMARAAHQRKMELPRDNFKVGDKIVYQTAHVTRYGEILEVNYEEGQAVIQWDHLSYTSRVDLVNLQLCKRSQVEEDVMPDGDKPEGAPSTDGERPQESGEAEKSVGTLMDALAFIGLAADDEYEALVEFSERVVAYEQVHAMSSQLGITMKPLPFELSTKADAERLDLTQLREPVPIGNADESGKIKILIIETLTKNGGSMDHSGFFNALGYGRKDRIQPVLRVMIERGEIKQTSERRPGARTARKVYALPA